MMYTRVGVSKHVGNGVSVGASTGGTGWGTTLLLMVLVMPGVLWFLSGISLLWQIATGTPMDTDDAELNLVCFVITIIELGLFFGLPLLLN